MKFLISSIFLFSFFINPLLSQQKSKIEAINIPVSGVCGMCAERIQDAAMLKGVKRARWNAQEQKLEIIYKPGKVSRDEIVASVLEKGHDADGKKGDDEVYNSLPNCCKYRDGVEIH